MRTTLTLDDDVAALLGREVRKSGQPFKEVVNRYLRAGLAAQSRPAPKPFVVTPINLGLRKDYIKVEELLEELEGPEYR